MQLQQDVLDELQYESIEAAGIGVTAKDGIIVLTGPVKSYSEKWSATRATERVSGVKAVVDEIKVKLSCTHERGDEDIAQAVLQALEWDVQVPHTGIYGRHLVVARNYYGKVCCIGRQSCRVQIRRGH